MKVKPSKNYKNKESFYNLEKENGNDKFCCLKFSQCDENRYQLSELSKQELNSFIDYAKKVEKLSWQSIHQNKGLNYEKIDTLGKPNYLDDSVSLYSMRASRKFRILGYRSKEFFYIVWFDNNHETC